VSAGLVKRAASHRPDNHSAESDAIESSTDWSSFIGLAEPTHRAAHNFERRVNDDQSQADTGVLANAEPLPALRTELKLETAQFDKNGQPAWTLQDPIRGKYYRLGWLEFELLSRWHCNDINVLIEKTNSQTTLRVKRSDVESLLTMLSNNELVQVTDSDAIQKLSTNAQSRKRTALGSAFSMRRYLIISGCLRSYG